MTENAGEAGSSSVLVRVNGDEITSDDVSRRITALFGNMADDAEGDLKIRITEESVDAEIKDVLFLQAAVNSGMVVDENVVDGEIAQAIEIMGDKPFEEMLRDRSSNLDEYRQFVKDRFLIEKFRGSLYQDVVVEESAVEEYFEGHTEKFANPELVRLHILIFDEAGKAEEMLESATGDEGFEKVTAKHIEIGGKSTTTRWMPVSAAPSGLSDKIQAAVPGSVLGHTGDTGENFVIKVLEKQAAGAAELEDVRELVRETVLNNRRQKILDKWYEGQVKTATIEHVRISAEE
jgi:hypothetical protein